MGTIVEDVGVVEGELPHLPPAISTLRSPCGRGVTPSPTNHDDAHHPLSMAMTAVAIDDAVPIVSQDDPPSPVTNASSPAVATPAPRLSKKRSSKKTKKTVEMELDPSFIQYFHPDTFDNNKFKSGHPMIYLKEGMEKSTKLSTRSSFSTSTRTVKKGKRRLDRLVLLSST